MKMLFLIQKTENSISREIASRLQSVCVGLFFLHDFIRLNVRLIVLRKSRRSYGSRQDT